MNKIDKELATMIIDKAITIARELNLNPIMVVILDERGAIKACMGEDGISPIRFKIAFGKANGAYQMGMGSRALYNRAEQQAYFINSVNNIANGELIPVPGGVLIKNQENELIGAIGISGDSSDNDEIAAVDAIKSNGLIPETG